MRKFDVRCSADGVWAIDGARISIKRFDDMIEAANACATEAIASCLASRDGKKTQDTSPAADQLWGINKDGWSYWLRFIEYEKEAPVPELWLLSAKKIGYSFDPNVVLDKKVVSSTGENIKDAPSVWVLAHDGVRA